MPTGDTLIAEIDACVTGGGRCAIWWLGQHSFVLKLGNDVLYVDPYLTASSRRRVPPLLAPGSVTHARFVLGTHDHADHIDRPTWPALAKASPEARFVVPEVLRPQLAADIGLPETRFVGLDAGLSVELGGLEIHAVPAAHELLDRDLRTGMHPYLGYVIRGNGCAIYHAGDTCIYEGMLTRLRRFEIDVALLPINGRDAERLARGCIGNMTYQEAADLAGALRPGLTVPTHFDMFEGNSENPRLFADYVNVKYPWLRTRVPVHGEIILEEGPIHE